MGQIYLDNAATTPLAPEVREAMLPLLGEVFGNPSSTHAIGRQARAALEQARKQIAGLLGVRASEIIFTSGGTEAINIFLLGIGHQVPAIVSSELEHPAVLRTLQYLEKTGVPVHWLAYDSEGRPDLQQLEKLLASLPGALVALMHGNNETGNLLPIGPVATLCREHQALFFTDAVQTLGYYPLEPARLGLAGMATSAHKYHGPKGAGFLYLRRDIRLKPVWHGGGQERSLRPGTENPAAIAGMTRALQLAFDHQAESRQHLQSLKEKMIALLREGIPGIRFNGTSARPEESVPAILSARFPAGPHNEMLVFKLDMAGVAVSAGSACASGAPTPSHVLQALGVPAEEATVRFSFSRYNTPEETEQAARQAIALWRNG